MGIVWELDENKRILMGYWWEQEEFDGNCFGNKTNFRVWWVEKVDVSGAQYLPSKLRPNFSIAIIIALARGGYLISHSCLFFVLFLM